MDPHLPSLMVSLLALIWGSTLGKCLKATERLPCAVWEKSTVLNIVSIITGIVRQQQHLTEESQQRTSELSLSI
jgi:hypothetical protein